MTETLHYHITVFDLQVVQIKALLEADNWNILTINKVTAL